MFLGGHVNFTGKINKIRCYLIIFAAIIAVEPHYSGILIFVIRQNPLPGFHAIHRRSTGGASATRVD